MSDVLRLMSAQILSTFHHHQVFVAPIQIVTTQLQVITAPANWDMKTGRRTQVNIKLRRQYVMIICRLAHTRFEISEHDA